MRKGKHGISRAEYIARAHEFAPRGNRLPHAKLTPDMVRDIRENREGKTANQWAQHLGVHVRTITGVREFRTWRHV